MTAAKKTPAATVLSRWVNCWSGQPASPCSPAWWNPTCCRRRGFGLSAESPKWGGAAAAAPILLYLWPPVRLTPASPSWLRAGFWSAGVRTSRCRSSSTAWPAMRKAMGTAAGIKIC